MENNDPKQAETWKPTDKQIIALLEAKISQLEA